MNNRCPRFDRCNASLCPLKMEGRHLDGEPICEYLRVAAKGYSLPDEVAEAISANLPVVINLSGDIRRRLKRASLCPRRGANLATTLIAETKLDVSE